MKLPFTFGTKLIFRLIFPGLIVAAALAPFLHSLILWAGFKIKLLTLLPFEIVIWGWAIVLADMPIYMLFEGRRFWPESLRILAMEFEATRLRALVRTSTEKTRQRDLRLYQESNIALLGFPLNDEGEPEVRYPTRLGNLLTAFESYPSRKYKLDAIFYWARVWVVLDKDLREEVDNSQALADSGVYVSFALWLAAVVLALYALATGSGAGGLPGFHLYYVPAPGVTTLFAGACVIAAYVIYRLTLHAQAQYGELFKALFDQFHGKLEFTDEVAKLVVGLGGDPLAVLRDETEKYRIAARYLRWHRIRPLGETVNYTPAAWQRELARRTAAGTGPDGSAPPP